MPLSYATTNRRKTSQTEPIPGENQVKNNAGGYVWEVGVWERLNRFLILGSDTNTYYQSAPELTRENTANVEKAIKANGPRAVDVICEVSLAGRAPKQEPAIFALALAASIGDDETRKYALQRMPEVCRTGTALFHFAAYCDNLRGWGRGLRNSVGAWYTSKSPRDLGYQLIKYQQRDGWGHRDLLRLAHPTGDHEHDLLFRYACYGVLPEALVTPAFAQIVAAESLKEPHIPHKRAAEIIVDNHLPRECVPTELLTLPEIWEALLQDMPMTALIRNLATMTRIGLLEPMSASTLLVVEKLSNGGYLKAARVHPITVLSALKTYAQGHGERGKNTWNPVSKITDGLDAAFYETFQYVEPTNKRIMVAVDVSGSMGAQSGFSGLTSRDIAAVMAMVIDRTEPNAAIFGFSTQFIPLDISSRRRLDDVVSYMAKMPFGGTNCALPMEEAAKRKVHVDAFVEITDNETWAGRQGHPAQALKAYRNAIGMPAKLAVAAVTSTGFTIADPNDSGMLDLVGFDSSAPTVINDFIRADVRPEIETERA